MRIFTHWTLAFVTVCLVTLFHYNNNYIVETARLKSFDLLQQSDKIVHSQDIAVVTIDEAALEKYGQWPWKRSILAGIIWELRQADVGIIVLPILFSEYDRLDGDQELLNAIADNGVRSVLSTSFPRYRLSSYFLMSFVLFCLVLRCLVQFHPGLLIYNLFFYNL